MLVTLPRMLQDTMEYKAVSDTRFFGLSSISGASGNDKQYLDRCPAIAVTLPIHTRLVNPDLEEQRPKRRQQQTIT